MSNVGARHEIRIEKTPSPFAPKARDLPGKLQDIEALAGLS